MPPRNNYLDNIIPNLYQRQTIDVMVFSFIDACKWLHPSMSIEECAKAFIKRHNIDEGYYSLKTCTTTYYRVLKDNYDVEKAKGKQQKGNNSSG